MREILFKGKRSDNGKWVKGNLSQYVEGIKASIYCDNYGAFEKITVYCVDPETVCEYAGIKDKNKTKVFEWDIVRCIYDGELFIGVVVWNEDDLGFEASNMKNGAERKFQYLGCCEEIEVIGNIFDNFDLLTTLDLD